jgi:hypothetical protein
MPRYNNIYPPLFLVDILIFSNFPFPSRSSGDLRTSILQPVFLFNQHYPCQEIVGTYRELITSLSPGSQIRIGVGISVIGDILGSGVISGITSHNSDSGSLVDSDVIDQVFSGEGEICEIDFLEIVRHSEVEDLGISSSRRREWWVWQEEDEEGMRDKLTVAGIKAEVKGERKDE